MALLRLPPYPAAELPAVELILRSVIDHDQYDDWVPDPVYLEDYRRNLEQTVAGLEGIWRSGQVDLRRPIAVEVAHGGAEMLPALSLALEARVCAQRVIAALAPRLAAVVPADKVYGFEYHSGRVPLFSLPGDGLREAWTQAHAVFLIDGEMRVADIARFSLSATAARLAANLRTFGARNDEAIFLEELIRSRGESLASVDDAFAFLYNFFLAPVDRSLAEAQIKFIRYRDEYFLFDEEGELIMADQLRRLGLEHVRKAHYNREELEYEFRYSAEESGHYERREAAYGTLAAEVEVVDNCEEFPDWEDCDLSDRWEVEFLGLRYDANQADAPGILFAMDPRAWIDGVRILPALRAINHARRSGVLEQRAGREGMLAFAEYRSEILEHRSWLLDAVTAAASMDNSWQIAWLAAMISDLGELSESESAGLLAVLDRADVADWAKLAVRVALARSSELPPERFWTFAGAVDSPYHTRASMLGAAYLGQRGHRGPWEQLEPVAGPQYPRLAELLSDYVERSA